MFEPAQDSRPRADVRIPRLARIRQRRPVSRRPRVVFDVVAVVEEEPIVEPTVMADRAARVHPPQSTSSCPSTLRSPSALACGVISSATEDGPPHCLCYGGRVLEAALKVAQPQPQQPAR